jgi:hypothetical protein
MVNAKPEIYFHVGLGKVASTFLQKKVFPKFENIHYIHSSYYGMFEKIVSKQTYPSYLISREFDRQFNKETTRLANYSTNIKIIIILRNPSEWVSSQYRRYVKNGGRRSILEFIGLDGNVKLWDTSEALFIPKIKMVKSLFNPKPLVLFHHDLKENPEAFISQIAEYCNARVDFSKISKRPYHKSYSEKQLLLMKRFSAFFKLCDPALRKDPRNKAIKWIKNKSRLHLNHLLLYLAAIVPGKFVRNEVLINDIELNKIKEYYKQDWEACLSNDY